MLSDYVTKIIATCENLARGHEKFPRATEEALIGNTGPEV